MPFIYHTLENSYALISKFVILISEYQINNPVI